MTRWIVFGVGMVFLSLVLGVTVALVDPTHDLAWSFSSIGNVGSLAVAMFRDPSTAWMPLAFLALFAALIYLVFIRQQKRA